MCAFLSPLPVANLGLISREWKTYSLNLTNQTKGYTDISYRERTANDTQTQALLATQHHLKDHACYQTRQTRHTAVVKLSEDFRY